LGSDDRRRPGEEHERKHTDGDNADADADSGQRDEPISEPIYVAYAISGLLPASYLSD
jgi:hypothetical protein